MQDNRNNDRYKRRKKKHSQQKSGQFFVKCQGFTSVASYDICFVHFQCTIEINMFRVNSFDFSATISSCQHHVGNMLTLIVPNVKKEEKERKKERSNKGERERERMSISDAYVLEVTIITEFV